MLNTNQTSVEKIEFIDLQAQRKALGNTLWERMDNVLEHGAYILGPEVTALEAALSAYVNVPEVITCSDGTNALQLMLMAHNVGPGDAIFVPTFTFASTAEVVARANATPIFVDICPQTFNIDLQSLERAFHTLKDKKLTPKGIIAVDLFGYPADYAGLQAFATAHQLWLLSDAAQSFGGAIGDTKVGALAPMTSTSFFPSKPLGCYGDGGAIFTHNAEYATLLRSLRNHGCGKDRYDHIHIGFNSRLDTLQAAILLEKLRIFPAELSRRNAIAQYYSSALSEHIQTPTVADNVTHAWGLYTIVCPDNKREALIDTLKTHNIPSNVYYRKPLHLQPAYAHFPRADEQLYNASNLCQRVLSLPMHPYLTDNQVEYIIAHVRKALVA